MNINKISDILKRMEEQKPDLFAHCERTAMLCYVTGKELKLSSDEIELVYFAGLLHEVGKLDIPSQILIDQTQNLIINSSRLYPFFTVSILKNYEGFNRLEEIIMQHCENHNGSGYPNGLKGDEIGICARILRIADYYDTLRMTGLTHDETTKKLREQHDIMYPNKIITPFIKSIRNNKLHEYDN